MTGSKLGEIGAQTITDPAGNIVRCPWVPGFSSDGTVNDECVLELLGPGPSRLKLGGSIPKVVPSILDRLGPDVAEAGEKASGYVAGDLILQSRVRQNQRRRYPTQEQVESA